MASTFQNAVKTYQKGGTSRLIERALHKINREINYKRWGYKYNPRGVNIFNEDWDNLIVLDSLRYDKFKEFNNIAGDLEFRKSRASATPEFIRGNFSSKSYLDTIYVTTNPQFQRRYENIGANVFHHELVETSNIDRKDEPTVLKERALKLLETYDDKRLLVHFDFPHLPYVDQNGNILMEGGTSIGEIRSQGFNKSEAISAYESTIKFILPHVEQLIDNLNGKSVITADHGETFEERGYPIPYRGYGHKLGNPIECLNKVPWHIVNNGERRRINTSDSPTDWKNSQPNINNRLKALGYKPE